MCLHYVYTLFLSRNLDQMIKIGALQNSITMYLLYTFICIYIYLYSLYSHFKYIYTIF